MKTIKYLLAINVLLASALRAEEIKGGLWSAQLHYDFDTYEVIGSFKKAESQKILGTILKANIGQEGYSRGLKLNVLTKNNEPLSFEFGCIDFLPRSESNDPGCKVITYVPFAENYGDNFEFHTDELSSLDLYNYLKLNTDSKLTPRGETLTYELGNRGRVLMKCTRESPQHIPECQIKVKNSFDSYNNYEPGLPDPIELASNGHISLNLYAFGKVSETIVQKLQKIIPLHSPIEGDVPGRLLNDLYLGGDEDHSEGELFCNQYPTDPENAAIRSCDIYINEQSNVILPFSLPLHVTAELTKESSVSLSQVLGSQFIVGPLDEHGDDSFFTINPIRPRMKMQCQSLEKCTIEIFQNKKD